jgi:hypothetical protein
MKKKNLKTLSASIPRLRVKISAEVAVAVAVVDEVTTD